MPLNFLRRGRNRAGGSGQGSGRGAAPGARPAGAGDVHVIPFDGLTEEWRLVGLMHAEGRLSDVVNRREPVAISAVRWAPIDGSEPFSDVPGLKSVDPYDLIIVLAGADSLPTLTDEQRAAHKVHRIAYDVALEAPPFRIIGAVHLHPGTDPDRLLDRGTEMFVPVVDAAAYLGEQLIGDPEVDAILVNRFYLRGVEQIDRRTGQKPQKLPGAPLGGISWRERSR